MATLKNGLFQKVTPRSHQNFSRKSFLHVKELVVACLLLLSAPFLSAHEIALTFDDLPGVGCESAESLCEINTAILDVLNKFNITAVGFVNEGKLYINDQADKKISILKSWVDNGHSLGNHTYSHFHLSESDLEMYQDDVVKGAHISKKLMQEAGLPYCYFRHPYLDTGSTKTMSSAFESFLKKEGYIIAPVTIDTRDWQFDSDLLTNPEKKEEIIAAYLAHTKKMFLHYKNMSQRVFGRNIKHVWDLHVNLLNSHVLEEVIKIAKSLGYHFIKLDAALKDKAYVRADNYYNVFFPPWLERRNNRPRKPTQRPNTHPRAKESTVSNNTL